MRILFLTHRLPYAPNRGDRIRAYHELRFLRAHARVDLVSLVHDADEQAHIDDLRNLADSVSVARVGRIRNLITGAFSLPTTMPLTHALLNSPDVPSILRRLIEERRPDVVLAYGSGMARFALEPPLASFPRIVDLVDVDSLKWSAFAASGGLLRWVYRREARRLAAFEAKIARSSFATVVVSEREREALLALAPNTRVDVVQLGIDHDYWGPTDEPRASAEVVFCGVMNYKPNEEAAVWLARHVWPLVRKERPDARLALVGSYPTGRVKRLAKSASIEVTGHVSDVRPYLWRAAVAAAPLQIARGTQGKVLEAVAAGLRTVVTPVVAEGLPAEILPACIVAHDARSFADALIRCLSLTPKERRAETERIDFRPLAWSARLEPLLSLLQRAAQRSTAADL